MENETVNIFLKLPWMREREYTAAAEKIVDELIRRFDSSDKDKRYMPMSEFMQYEAGLVRFSEADTNAFQALVCRLSIERGFFVTLLPVIDPVKSDGPDIYFEDLIYRAAPIHAPKLGWDGNPERPEHKKPGIYIDVH